MLSREQLQRAAADSGFQVESYEKVHVLVRLLEADSHAPISRTTDGAQGRDSPQPVRPRPAAALGRHRPELHRRI